MSITPTDSDLVEDLLTLGPEMSAPVSVGFASAPEEAQEPISGQDISDIRVWLNSQPEEQGDMHSVLVKRISPETWPPPGMLLPGVLAQNIAGTLDRVMNLAEFSNEMLEQQWGGGIYHLELRAPNASGKQEKVFSWVRLRLPGHPIRTKNRGMIFDLIQPQMGANGAFMNHQQGNPYYNGNAGVGNPDVIKAVAAAASASAESRAATANQAAFSTQNTQLLSQNAEMQKSQIDALTAQLIQSQSNAQASAAPMNEMLIQQRLSFQSQLDSQHRGHESHLNQLREETRSLREDHRAELAALRAEHRAEIQTQKSGLETQYSLQIAALSESLKSERFLSSKEKTELKDEKREERDRLDRDRREDLRRESDTLTRHFSVQNSLLQDQTERLKSELERERSKSHGYLKDAMDRKDPMSVMGELSNMMGAFQGVQSQLEGPPAAPKGFLEQLALTVPHLGAAIQGVAAPIVANNARASEALEERNKIDAQALEVQKMALEGQEKERVRQARLAQNRATPRQIQHSDQQRRGPVSRQPASPAPSAPPAPPAAPPQQEAPQVKPAPQITSSADVIPVINGMVIRGAPASELLSLINALPAAQKSAVAEMIGGDTSEVIEAITDAAVNQIGPNCAINNLSGQNYLKQMLLSAKGALS